MAGSFRDPAGFVYVRDGVLFRSVSVRYEQEYDHLMASGLYDSLVCDGLLVRHQEIPSGPSGPPGTYRTLLPELVPFVSYPYEHCASQIRAAAKLLCEVQRRSIRHGMTLKDASAYNVMFRGPKPVLIDTLSFDFYPQRGPWRAYRQFCEHFVVPLALARAFGGRILRLQRDYLDGIPVDLADRMVPWRPWRGLSLGLHLNLHARFARREYSCVEISRASGEPVKPAKLLALVDSLEALVDELKSKTPRSGWSFYSQQDGAYDGDAKSAKARAVEAIVGWVRPRVVWDLGANTGEYSRMALASEPLDLVLALDADPDCVEACFARAAADGATPIHPIVQDLFNPSPRLGPVFDERLSLLDRANADLVFALALVHHLAILAGVSFERLARLLATLGRAVVIEFASERDSVVGTLLSRVPSARLEYSVDQFERAFAQHFRILEKIPLGESQRCIYFMVAAG